MNTLPLRRQFGMKIDKPLVAPGYHVLRGVDIGLHGRDLLVLLRHLLLEFQNLIFQQPRAHRWVSRDAQSPISL